MRELARLAAIGAVSAYYGYATIAAVSTNETETNMAREITIDIDDTQDSRDAWDDMGHRTFKELLTAIIAAKNRRDSEMAAAIGESDEDEEEIEAEPGAEKKPFKKKAGRLTDRERDLRDQMQKAQADAAAKAKRVEALEKHVATFTNGGGPQ